MRRFPLVTVALIFILSVACSATRPGSASPAVTATTPPSPLLAATTAPATVGIASVTPTTAASSATIAPPTPAALTPEEVARSLRENLGFASKASLDGLQVTVREGIVTISIKPRVVNEADALSVDAATELVALRALSSYYPEITTVETAVGANFTDQSGQTLTVVASSIQVALGRATQSNLDGERTRVLYDYRLIFCDADHYAIHPSIWSKVRDTNCLAAPSR